MEEDSWPTSIIGFPEIFVMPLYLMSRQLESQKSVPQILNNGSPHRIIDSLNVDVPALKEQRSNIHFGESAFSQRKVHGGPNILSNILILRWSLLSLETSTLY